MRSVNESDISTIRSVPRETCYRETTYRNTSYGSRASGLRSKQSVKVETSVGPWRRKRFFGRASLPPERDRRGIWNPTRGGPKAGGCRFSKPLRPSSRPPVTNARAGARLLYCHVTPAAPSTTRSFFHAGGGSRRERIKHRNAHTAAATPQVRHESRLVITDGAPGEQRPGFPRERGG